MNRMLTSLLILVMMSVPLAIQAKGHGVGGGWEERRAAKMDSLSQLPEDKQNLVKSTMQNMRESHRGTHQELRSLEEELKSIYAAETFDAEKYVATAAKIKAIRDGMHQQRIDTMVQLGKQLNQQERGIVSDVFSPKRFKHRR